MRNSTGVKAMRGPWDRSQIESYLGRVVTPLRLAFHTPSGYPGLVSLWFLYEEGALWCAVSENSWVCRCVKADRHGSFEVSPNEPPYLGVRGKAEIEVVADRGEPVLRRLIERYLGDTESDLATWLLGRSASEVALRIEPQLFSSWDYTERMN